MRQNLINAADGGSGGSKQVSYPYFVAFISLLSNIELIKKIYLNATNGSRIQEITKGLVQGTTKSEGIILIYSFPVSEEFLHSAQMMSQITPLEVDILFHLCDLLHQTG